MAAGNETGRARARFRAVSREPLVWFALCGLLVFGIHAAIRGRSGGDARARVGVSAERVTKLREDFRRSFRREPGRDELADLLLREVSEEVLYREAVATGLDRDDPIVRRRLIEKMSVFTRGGARLGEPTRQQLEVWYGERRHRFAQPPRVDFEHVFFDAQRRGARLSDDARAARGRLRAGVRVEGDRAALPPRTGEISAASLDVIFGSSFTAGVQAARAGSWEGPLSSSRGLHVVRVHARTPGRQPSFAEVEKEVRADWLTEHARGHVEAARAYLPRYEIELPAETRRELGDAPLLAPLWRSPR